MVATLAKMAVPTYYIESQAAHEGHEVKGPDAGEGYYTGGGKERPGEWYNPTGLFRLKDGGLVYDKKFYALAKGFSPELDGTNLVRNAGSEKRSPGFDLTFSADKSISALWAISRGDEREAIERAVIDAAREALRKTVFEHCATTRIGAAGKDLRVETGDMLAATFLHRTSRDADPQLHVHSTIFNVVKTHADGKFRSLHGHPLYSWKMAAGAAFRSHLAHLMRTRFEVEMERHGPEGQYTRVAAMDPDLEREWSKRRAQIVETVDGYLGEEALTNPAQMSAATLATRQRKVEGTTTEQDIARFREEAAEIVDIAELRQRIRETPVAEIAQEFIDAAHEEVTAIPAKLARMDAVFRQPDIVEKVENALGGAVAGDAAERWHELSLAGADLIGLEYKEPNPDAQAGMAHKRIFTTRDTLRAEHTLTRLSHLSVADRAHAVPKERVDAQLHALEADGKKFSAEQTRAIRHAASRPGRLALVEGAAGSGKSHVLHPLAELWRGEGKSVRALAVAWRTAVDLGTDMQAPPSAVYPFLRDVRKGAKTVDADTVLVVDEAGMLSTRQALQLVQLSETTGCKLVLVGDTQQQQPVEAGPGMRIVRDAVGSVRIDRIRRQLPDLEDYLREVDGLSPDEAAEQAAGMDRAARDAARERYREMNRARRKAGEKPLSIERPWQIGISGLLRNGAMHQAFLEFHRRGRLGLVEGKEEALQDLVGRWAAYTREHPSHSTIVMARTRADVRALSALLRARHHAAAGKRASGKDSEIQSAIIRVHRIGDRGKAVEANLEVRLGERLRIGATVYDLGLYNGAIVTVTGIEQRRGEDGTQQCRLTVRTADRRTVSFAPEEIRNWIGETALDHGYAATVTSAQGMTVDAAFLLLDEGMARESTYPACTRHKRHLELVADRQSVAVGIAGATPDGDPGHEVEDDEVLSALGQLCGRSAPKEAAIDHLLAEKRLEMELEGEIELGREAVPGARAANDGLDPGGAGTGPHDPATGSGAAARRHADRAAVERIVAAADRRTARSADRATAVALAADMEEVEREWTAIAAPAEPVADPDTAGEMRRTLDRHRNVLNRVRVFLRSRTRGSEDGKHHPRISGLGYDAFAGLGRSMQRRWREALRADEARLAAKAETQAQIRNRSEALNRDWDELRSRVGQEPLAFLEDPEHAGLLRRTVELATDSKIDRDTARSWRSFIDGHYAAVGAELRQAWKKAAPLQQDTGGPLSPQSVAGYGRLMRRASAFAAALDHGAALPGDRKAERKLWHRRIGSAPTYQDITIRLIEQFGEEEALMRRREEQLPGSTLPTRRLADHMATLNGAAALDGFNDKSRKKIRGLVRQHREARRQAGVTRTDAPWPNDEQIERRIETGRQLREGWRMLNEAKREDPLAPLDYSEHRYVIERTVRHASDPSLDADTARKQATYLARHFQELDAALEKARSAVRMPTASPGWRYAEFRQYHSLRMHAARFTLDLPDAFTVPGVPGGKWQDWLNATPSTEEASDMLLLSIRAEDAAIRDRETLLPGETLPTQRLHDHMETLRAATGFRTIVEFRDRDESGMLEKRLQAWTEAREAAGVTRTDGRWLTDRAARLRAEHLALDKAWKETWPYVVPDQASLLDRPDHRDLVARTLAFAAELEDNHSDLAQKWRDRLRSHVGDLNWHLNDAFHVIAGGSLSSNGRARNVEQLDRYFLLPRRLDAFADMLAAVAPAMTRPVDFDLQDWKRRLAEALSGQDVYGRFVEDLFKEERIIMEREDGLPGSTLSTRRLGEHMAVLEALISNDLVGPGDKQVFQDLLDGHRQARANAGVTVANLPWPETPELQAAYEYQRIRDAVERARAAAGDGSIVYEPGIEALGREAAKLLATPWLSADGRRYLKKFQIDLDSGTDNRDTVRSTIERARALLREYPAILERALAPKPPAPDEPASRPGLFGRVRQLFGDEDDIPARHPAEPAPQALNDFDPDYRKWDVLAEQFVKKFRTWRAADNAAQRDHVDRRWIDMADLIAEFEVIRSAARDPEAKPYRIETPDVGAFPAADQRHDPDRLSTLIRDVIRPEDERSSEAVLELARRNRAWPRETLAVFRRHARQAADAGETRSLSRLSAGLPANLARSFENLAEEVYKRQGEVLTRRQELTQGRGWSM